MIKIKKLSECEFAPNILYEIVRNETKYYQYLKVGGFIRGPNCNSHSIVGAYWENYGKENEHFMDVIRNIAESDWKDKIFVKYDKEYVYKTLYNNAKQEYEYYSDITEMCRKKMEKYQGVLNESNCLD